MSRIFEQSGVMLHENYYPYELKNFNIQTLVVKSKGLKSNPLKDPLERQIPVLVPKKNKKPLSVIFVLAGFSGVGGKYFNIKFKENNFTQELDVCVTKNKAPNALYVFVDAITYWGGSQFINSKGTGDYEDFIIKEVYKLVKSNFQVSNDPAKWCVMGGSSGGYGALHLASKYPDKFSWAAAIAPDCFFEMSLLPEIYTALPVIIKFGGIHGIKKEIETGRFLNRRDSFSFLNAIGMGTCYAPHPQKKHEVLWPIDINTGVINKKHWNKWCSHDPINFLKKRLVKVKKLKGVYLDVGTRDQYHLQYGTRQIFNTMRAVNKNIYYSEFSGSHYDIGQRRPNLWSWLMGQGF